MKAERWFDTLHHGGDGLRNDLPTKHASGTKGHEQVYGAEQVNVNLLDLKGRRNLGAFDLIRLHLHSVSKGSLDGEEVLCDQSWASNEARREYKRGCLHSPLP